jgi:nuclear pore complex protein Nup205
MLFYAVLQVVENGNPLERMNWFLDIEHLFKLLGYENVPPYLKVSSIPFVASLVYVRSMGFFHE